MIKDLTKGIIYAASGADYIKEAAVSANSVKKAMPGVPITIYSDSTKDLPSVFDYSYELRPITHSYEDKIVALNGSPFDKTLF